MINLDLEGNGIDGATVVNASVFPEAFAHLKAINTAHGYLPELKMRGEASNSDHYWFSRRGVPAFFLYLLGKYPWYHDIDDVPKRLGWQGYEGTFRLIRDFMEKE